MIVCPMKRSFFLLAIVFATSLFAAEQRGTFVVFPDAKPQGAQYKPQMAVAQENVGAETVSYLVLKLTGSTEYNAFDNTSRILLRFSDDTKMTLPRVEGDEVKHESSNNVVNGTTLFYYRTYTRYQLSEEFISKIQQGVGIVKVRVVLSEGNARDYDIAPAYIPKMTERLQKSCSEAISAASKSQTVLSDDDF